MAKELSSRSLELFEACLMIVLNVLSLLGNILVCIAVYRNTRLRTTTNLYIIALAVGDLLYAFFVMPLSTGVLITGRWPFGETLCQMSGFITVFVVYVSPVTMGLTALNRFVRICKTDQQYKRFFSRRKCRIMLAVAWTFVALYLIGMTSLSGLQEFRFGKDSAVCLNVHLSKVGSIIHYFVAVGLFFILPLTVTMFSYRKVYKKIREHNMGAGQALHTQAWNAAITPHEIRISRSLFVVVFAFMFCWLPLWVVNLLNRVRVAANMPRNILLLGTFCVSLSNTINPFIYAGMNPAFRKEFRKILRCASTQLVQDIPRAPNEMPLGSVSISLQEENNDNQIETALEICGRQEGRDDGRQDSQGTELK